MGFAQCPAEYGEILCKNIHQSSGDGAVARHDAVAEVVFLVEAEIAATVHDKLADFLETVFVQQQLNAFAGGQFAFFVLGFYPFFSAAQQGFGVFSVEFGEGWGKGTHGGLQITRYELRFSVGPARAGPKPKLNGIRQFLLFLSDNVRPPVSP